MRENLIFLGDCHFLIYGYNFCAQRKGRTRTQFDNEVKHCSRQRHMCGIKWSGSRNTESGVSNLSLFMFHWVLVCSFVCM